MPDHDDSANKESLTKEAIGTVVEMLLKDEEFKKSLGRRTSYLILATLAIAVAEFMVGLPLITLTSSPVIAVIITFLIIQVEDWLQSGKPKTTFYLCPNEQKFIRISRSSEPRYRKVLGCIDCGAPLIKKCQQGKHPIVSLDLEGPEGQPPNIDSFCPLCDPSLPEEDRAYLPKDYRVDRQETEPSTPEGSRKLRVRR